MTVKNSKGQVFYGLHFYPGVAEYAEPGRDPYRVFLNEDTLRKMDPTFAGRPVFVMHVDGVEQDINKLREDADGWVIESFFNQADGKHWVKFLVVSDKGLSAVKKGMQLSNCYEPKSFAGGGVWNGVSYAKEIKDGEYEHLAIVPNPRYDESVIMTPDQFKAYNEKKNIELEKIANDNKGEDSMAIKLNIFKRSKVENSVELEGLVVQLPKSKKEIALTELVTNADEAEQDKDKPKVVNATDLVEVDGEKVAVADLVVAFQNAKKKKNKDKEEKEDCMNDDDEGEDEEMDMENEDDDKKEEKDEKKEKKENKKKKKNSDEEDSDEDAEDTAERKENELAARRKAKEKADRLRNAHNRGDEPEVTVELSSDKVARGKARYGSN